MHFVGVDLAWSPRHTTGVAVAVDDGSGARIAAHRADLRGHEAVAAFVEAAVGDGEALVAIDAPLVVPNEISLRPCDREVNARFRRFHAGVHPVSRSTLRRYDGFEGERLRDRLLKSGYRDAVPLPVPPPARGLFETYPHAASVVLFNLEERLPYKARGKKRPWSVREQAFRRLQDRLLRLEVEDPSLVVEDGLLNRDVAAMGGGERKRYEDLLDAVLCAYIALYAWARGPADNEVLGTVEEGYMVLPVDERVRGRAPAA